tara:strand:- start:2926 stop:3105 length:180 start_codon:yes stop_codon:yes gene_type:complete
LACVFDVFDSVGGMYFRNLCLELPEVPEVREGGGQSPGQIGGSHRWLKLPIRIINLYHS